ncbi:MAG: FAD-binding oxidoreductase [Aestuariivita sp.]|nr:FAD-binding oxidoreductase [Aestuariivita sp.]
MTSALEDLERNLRRRLAPDCFREIDSKYGDEPRGRFHGSIGLLLAPRRVSQVSKILAACHKSHVPVVPYGGGTGLVGGQVLEGSPAPVVISMERMNRIRSSSSIDNVIVAEAGVTLADLQTRADSNERFFPLSLASEGSTQLGGNLATNAGGINVLRYGSMRDLCLGLEVVLPDGRILNGLTQLRKDNTGYDLKNLFIGSEGTLGVITAAALKLVHKPRVEATLFLAVNDPAAALCILSQLQSEFGNSISAFELIHKNGLKFIRETHPDVKLPFPIASDWSILIDIGVSGEGELDKRLETVLEKQLEEDLVLDGLIAQSQKQQQHFWSIRELIPAANRRIGTIASHDISLPLGAITQFIHEASKKIDARGKYRINCFGHLGDGNLHFNIFPPRGVARDDCLHHRERISRVIYDLVDRYGGSISAEHGIGRLKTEELERYGDPTKLAVMRQIKRALDPHDIMNPGAVLASGSDERIRWPLAT